MGPDVKAPAPPTLAMRAATALLPRCATFPTLRVVNTISAPTQPVGVTAFEAAHTPWGSSAFGGQLVHSSDEVWTRVTTIVTFVGDIVSTSRSFKRGDRSEHLPPSCRCRSSGSVTTAMPVVPLHSRVSAFSVRLGSTVRVWQRFCRPFRSRQRESCIKEKGDRWT